jgi:hypothetical protein
LVPIWNSFMRFRCVAFLVLAVSYPTFADLKSTNRMTVAGQTFASTVLIRQGKIREEASTAPGLSSVTIQDCAGHRVIQLNDRTHTYMLTEMAGSDASSPAASSAATAGTVTLNVAEQDTGERKQLFGYTARRVKGTVTAEGGSASCNGTFHVTTDGWYIDVPEIQGCVSPDRQILRSQMQREGCNDRIVLKASGIDKLGYPLILDTTLEVKGSTVTVHQQTTDLSTAALDPSLFEIPAGYRQVQSYQELMDIGRAGNSTVGMSAEQSRGQNFPPVTGSGANENANGVVAGASQTTIDKKKGALRIGITQITSATDLSLSVEGLQQLLVNDINFLGGQAVLIAADPNDRDATLEQAKQQGCDYVIFTNITNFKQASVGQRLGSVLGRGGLGGVGGSAQGRVEITAEARVFQPDNDIPVIDGSEDFRQNDPDVTAKGLMQVEARDVMLQIRKLQTAK